PVEPTPDEEEVAEDEEAATSEPADVPSEPGGLSSEEQAKAFDKALKRANTYIGALPGILGESMAELSACPRCSDFLPGVILPLAIKPVSDEQALAVKVSI